jgi:hypothetical protein
VKLSTQRSGDASTEKVQVSNLTHEYKSLRSAQEKKNSTFRFVFNDLPPPPRRRFGERAKCLFARAATAWSEEKKSCFDGRKKVPDSHQQSIAKYIIVILGARLFLLC